MVCAMKVGPLISYASCNLKLIGAFKYEKRYRACWRGGVLRNVQDPCRYKRGVLGVNSLDPLNLRSAR